MRSSKADPTTPTTSGVEQSTTNTWLCGGSRVSNQQRCLRERRCLNEEQSTRMVALRERVARTRVCTSGCLDDIRITSMRRIAVFGGEVEQRKKKRNSGARRRK